MADYKNLLLDPAKIDAGVREFAAGREVTGPKKTPQFTEYGVEGPADEPPCTIQVFEKATGRLTLHFKVGQNQAQSELLAQHLATSAARAALDPKPLALKQVTEEHWEYLLELLREEKLQVVEEVMKNGARFRVSVNGVDNVLIHRYSTGSFLMQGKQYSAYGKVVEVLSSMSSEREAVIVAQLETLEIKNVTVAGLFDELDERMPHACKALDETSKYILAPSIVFAKVDIALPDYSSFTHPSLRGLEACMKHLLSANGFVAAPQEGMAHFFDKTTQTLKLAFKSSITCTQTIGALEEFYSLYAKDRNALFHADGTPITSRIIEKRNEAVAIIESVFITIEKGFRCIATGTGYA